MSDELRERIDAAMREILSGPYDSVLRNRATDAVMVVVNEYRPDLTEDLRETTRLLLSTTRRAERAERLAHAFKEGGRISANEFNARIDMLNDAIRAYDGVVAEAKERAEKAERELKEARPIKES